MRLMLPAWLPPATLPLRGGTLFSRCPFVFTTMPPTLELVTGRVLSKRCAWRRDGALCPCPCPWPCSFPFPFPWCLFPGEAEAGRSLVRAPVIHPVFPWRTSFTGGQLGPLLFSRTLPLDSLPRAGGLLPPLGACTCPWLSFQKVESNESFSACWGEPYCDLLP